LAKVPGKGLNAWIADVIRHTDDVRRGHRASSSCLN